MPEKFRDQYRVSSIRLPNWDYGSNAVYFITICTQNREFYFGKITEGKMNLSESGKMANHIWYEIPKHFSFVLLDEFVVMPDHIHGIIIINKSITDCHVGGSDDGNGGGNGGGNDDRDAINRVSTNIPDTNIPDTNIPDTNIPVETNDPIIDKTGGFSGLKNPMLNDNLSRIIRWYKGRVSFEIRKIHSGFAWQSRFYDHIIRDEKSYYKIRNYIKANTLHWDENEFLAAV